VSDGVATEGAAYKAFDIAPYRSQIEAALVYADATHTYDDVARLIAAGELQAWPGPASVIVTELVEYPRKTVLNFFLAGGNLRELRAMAPLICEWGKAHGATHATFTGRKGWERSFITREQGWDASLTFYSKAL
jgi:hypothetical protein